MTLSTDLDLKLYCLQIKCIQLGQILEWFTRRWQIEVTFEEVRKHLGLETQRQWSDLAIAQILGQPIQLKSHININKE